MPEQLNTTLVNEQGEVQRFIEIAEEFCRRNNFSEKDINSVCLIFDELLTNTINYGYSDDRKHEINILIETDGSYFSAELIDDAVPFNPLDQPEAETDIPVEEREIGGLGIHIVKKIADELSYERLADRNILRIKKNIKQ
ncbi:MAG: ATP-binding protein [Syntrophothermus sp.]